MTTETKKQIKAMFIAKCEKLGISQNTAAVKAGLKATTVSQVLTGKYPADDTQVYQTLAQWVEHGSANWTHVSTKNFNLIANLVMDAKKKHNVYGLIGPAGCGKTKSFKIMASNERNVLLLCCNEFWNRKAFLQELLKQMGKEHDGLTVRDMMALAVENIMKLSNPVIILDEADKLSDQVLYFFITLYNALEDECGIIMAATSHLEKRVKKGYDNNRKGYAEIYSRLGRRFVALKENSKRDIIEICKANGVNDEVEINDIISDAEGDLRRVKRGVHRFQLKQNA